MHLWISAFAARPTSLLCVVAALALPLVCGDAAEPRACDPVAASERLAAADRARARAEFAGAGQTYLAAAALQAGCRDARATLERARALAFAGAALAQAGDYLRAQTVLAQARDGLADVGRTDPQRARDARRYADLVDQVIAAIDAVARASM